MHCIVGLQGGAPDFLGGCAKGQGMSRDAVYLLEERENNLARRPDTRDITSLCCCSGLLWGTI